MKFHHYCVDFEHGVCADVGGFGSADFAGLEPVLVAEPAAAAAVVVVEAASCCLVVEIVDLVLFVFVGTVVGSYGV